jgi:hypothetical protein
VIKPVAVDMMSIIRLLTAAPESLFISKVFLF